MCAEASDWKAPPQPENSCGQALPPGASSAQVSGLREAVPRLTSAAVAIVTAYKAAEWLPTCLAMLRLPSGGISHDPWCWAPTVLDLLALVAIGAPISFRNILDVAAAFWPRRRQA